MRLVAVGCGFLSVAAAVVVAVALPGGADAKRIQPPEVVKVEVEGTVAGNSSSGVNAGCPGGTQAIGAGWIGAAGINATGLFPLSATEWRLTVFNSGGSSLLYKLVLRCVALKLLQLAIRSVTTTLPAQGSAELTPSCNSGETPVGVGFDLDGQPFISHPKRALQGLVATLFFLNLASTPSRAIRAFVLCAIVVRGLIELRNEFRQVQAPPGGSSHQVACRENEVALEVLWLFQALAVIAFRTGSDFRVDLHNFGSSTREATLGVVCATFSVFDPRRLELKRVAKSATVSPQGRRTVAVGCPTGYRRMSVGVEQLWLRPFGAALTPLGVTIRLYNPRARAAKATVWVNCGRVVGEEGGKLSLAERLKLFDDRLRAGEVRSRRGTCPAGYAATGGIVFGRGAPNVVSLASLPVVPWLFRAKGLGAESRSRSILVCITPEIIGNEFRATRLAAVQDDQLEFETVQRHVALIAARGQARAACPAGFAAVGAGYSADSDRLLTDVSPSVRLEPRGALLQWRDGKARGTFTVAVVCARVAEA